MTVITFSWLISIGLIILGFSLMHCSEDKRTNCLHFLRNNTWGLTLFGIASFWFLIKIANLGEADFGAYKHWLLFLFISIFIGCGIYWKDFLVVRAIAMLTLMLCHLGLQVGYMSSTIVRPFLSLLFYSLIILALFFGTYPFKARDLLPVLFSKKARYLKWLGVINLSYGFLLIILSLQ